MSVNPTPNGTSRGLATRMPGRKKAENQEERVERADNDGFIVEKRLKATEAELRSLLKGAPKAVRDVLASEYGAAMRPKDYEDAAWWAGHKGDIGEIMTVKDKGFSLDMPSERQGSTPFYIACAQVGCAPRVATALPPLTDSDLPMPPPAD